MFYDHYNCTVDKFTNVPISFLESINDVRNNCCHDYYYLYLCSDIYAQQSKITGEPLCEHQESCLSPSLKHFCMHCGHNDSFTQGNIQCILKKRKEQNALIRKQTFSQLIIKVLIITTVKQNADLYSLKIKFAHLFSFRTAESQLDIVFFFFFQGLDDFEWYTVASCRPLFANLCSNS